MSQQYSSIRTVPEHSVSFMAAISGGKSVIFRDYLFLTGEGWLIAVGYPFGSPHDAREFFAALTDMAEKTQAGDYWAIAPEMPQELQPHVDETDVYYVLPVHFPVPAKVRGPVRKAANSLTVDEGKVFTAAHRRLWAEFLRRKDFKPHVHELFARTASMLAAPGTDVRLLNAWDAGGDLAACCVMDYSPQEFSSYIIGAHSRENYTPHATDLLFAMMLENARKSGKRYIHLGLGVNDGIRRFKEKWGAVKTLPYQAASWKKQNLQAQGRKVKDSRADFLNFSLSALGVGRYGARHQEERESLSDQRDFAMLWKLEKNGKTSWIGGTAHIFRYSFAPSFRNLFQQADTVLFEGPLDAASLEAVTRHGSTLGAGPRLADCLAEQEIQRLERVVRGPEGKLARFLNMAWEKPLDVRRVLAEHRPWSVFFTLYYAFLERNGWRHSVDLEAWEIARSMNRHMVAMESIPDQIASLESVPLERILRFLRCPETWGRKMRQSLRAYLAGDLEKMLGTGTEFPTRTERVISMRDHLFLKVMRPYIERGRAVVLVGTAHMLNLEKMLREDGFRVSKVYPSLLHKIRARMQRMG